MNNPEKPNDFLEAGYSIARKRVDLDRVKKIDIKTKHVGSFCEIFFVRVIADNFEQRFVIRIFGRGKDFSLEELTEVRKQIMLYQAQLNASNLIIPYYNRPDDIEITTIDNENLIVAYEPWFGDFDNHFDLIGSDHATTAEKQKIIFTDLALLLELQTGKKVHFFDRNFELLKVGIDSKPDNFTTHQNTTVYIDLFPPLTIGKNGLISHHHKFTAPHKMEAVSYMMGTLEGVILRYLRSAEFRLSDPKKIQMYYSDILEFLNSKTDPETFQYIRSQIMEHDFAEMNKAYKILLSK